ncbi:hypothetical protein GO986_07310 [Deinococcus sp. HMF7620]|uniref:DUF4279 domain-containing protein n=1 Tax=Deinococcus arboris TaxID=2682977 RepID=A0A7C9I2J0_9DEIO|nr:hypothetical protein [Deinococcus arboris]MVN86571.1 hypothetical protein [Deinococcus arboris]
MSCILRVYGHFDVTAFLAGTAFAPHWVWRAGDLLGRPPRPVGDSGFLLATSQAEFDQPGQQIEDTILFLETHNASLLAMHQRLTATDPTLNHSDMELDFGIEDRVGTPDEQGREIVLQGDYFPSQLIRLAGQLGLSLTVSRYPRTLPEDTES